MKINCKRQQIRIHKHTYLPIIDEHETTLFIVNDDLNCEKQ